MQKMPTLRLSWLSTVALLAVSAPQMPCTASEVTDWYFHQSQPCTLTVRLTGGDRVTYQIEYGFHRAGMQLQTPVTGTVSVPRPEYRHIITAQTEDYDWRLSRVVRVRYEGGQIKVSYQPVDGANPPPKPRLRPPYGLRIKRGE